MKTSRIKTILESTKEGSRELLIQKEEEKVIF